MCDVGQPHEHKDFGFLVGAPEIRALVDDTRRLTAEIPDTAARGGRAASGEQGLPSPAATPRPGPSW